MKTYEDGIKQLSGGVCHSARQPLQGAMGYIELAQIKLKSGQDVTDILHKAFNELQRISSVLTKVEKIGRDHKSIVIRDYLKEQIIDLEN